MNTENRNNNSSRDNPNITVKENNPDERGTISIQGNVKIFDPETSEVFINVRT